MTTKQHVVVHNIKIKSQDWYVERSATFASIFCKVSGGLSINEAHDSSCFVWHKKGPDGTQQLVPLSGQSTPASVSMDATRKEKIFWKRSGILTLFK